MISSLFKICYITLCKSRDIIIIYEAWYYPSLRDMILSLFKRCYITLFKSRDIIILQET